MLRHRQIDRIVCLALAVTLLLTGGLMGAAAGGLIEGMRVSGYEKRLFDQSRVHAIDIVMDDWDEFIAGCTDEEYVPCTVVIDGEAYGNVAIRAKGNTSLSQVSSYGNNRYSFKIEFDHYQTGMTCHGLDKLSLNNLIQDKTYMKDYLAYTLMNKMGVAAPLCSFVQINVNEEAWGLYLAVEGVEDSFLSRSYGSNPGELYKPDSMSMGGGRGNGREFDMEAFNGQLGEAATGDMPGDFDPSRMGGFDPSEIPTPQNDGSAAAARSGIDPMQRGGDDSRGFGGDMGARGAADVMLQYIDDDPASYTNIFGNAKTDVTGADQQRLIASLKTLSEGENIEAVVDTEAVMRYLVVHDFLCNGDSYTGSMVHNYYLYEENGVLSMIPWDYNLAFGAFGMGGGNSATSTVNSPIDSPVSSGEISSRPIISWIFESEEYTQRYHELYGQFVEVIQADNWLSEEIARVRDLIAPYVETETRAFFTHDEFTTATEALDEFCTLRAQSIAGQLNGTIPSTAEGQRADGAALVDASGLDLGVMGEFNHGGDDMQRSGGMGEMRQMGFGGRTGMPAVPSGFAGGKPQEMLMPGQQAASGKMQAGGVPGMQQAMMTSGRQASGMKTEGGAEEPAAASAPEDETVQGADGNAEAAKRSRSSADSREANRQAVGNAVVGQNAWLLGGSALVLAAAIVFAGLYKVNR